MLSWDVYIFLRAQKRGYFHRVVREYPPPALGP